MKQSLQLKFSQHLALTPQLQQSIRLLQLSSQELNQELEGFLQANPLLERLEPGSETGENGESYIPTAPGLGEAEKSADPVAEAPVAENFGEDYFDSPGGSNRWEESGAGNDDADDSDFGFQEAATLSLHDHLLRQLQLLPLCERDLGLCLLLVDAINDDGYLEQSLEDLVSLLDPALGDFVSDEDKDRDFDPVELETALKHIQHLDPPGVGARSLSECLLLQLQTMPADTPSLQLACDIAREHLPLLAARDYARLRKVLHCDDDALRNAQQMLTQLNPRPGAAFSHIASDHFIQHEIVVKKVKGIWLASLNDEVVPKLRINQIYANILKRNRDSSSQYLMSQMQEAKWMIKNIQQRFSTILRVSQAIVDRQRNFFEHGEVAMRPLVLREIADELGLHESTISRVTTRKYMLTPRGVYELKYFFGSHVATEAGGACSATAIRALIKQMVAEENPQKPLSDSQITEILGKQGIVVARRTIAKYRESLQIAAASQRKSL
ncbi:RNA polymerase factor sigma-54 [Pseudomethylobacillus aquaticus]|uniref:RNA polymerase sigma-54 factor n=1 Tax=Pseudomethylobacillus aquaticus TaxID=2676064 RepID=A0A3N0UZ43_9PROT|nr:RNA polymerase factor sigma-54 [Pseudomethylobacillus aquaticus]ROH85829.1 RNA polymerase factor sigma-54 [Pseudomethylobacillus aquaticus]